MDSIGGDLALTEIIGPLEIEGRNTDLKIDDIKDLKAPLRINSTGGDIVVRGLRSEARLDGRNSIIEVTLAAPAPVTIYNLGDIRVTAPPGGYAHRRRGHRRAHHHGRWRREAVAKDPTRTVTGPSARRRSDAHDPRHARQHHGPEACGQITKFVPVCSSQFTVTGSTVYSFPCSPPPPSSKRPSPI